MHDTVYYNEQFKNINDVHISINDRGYLYGHSIYESISIINQRALLLPEHFNRLSSGLHVLGIENPLFNNYVVLMRNKPTSNVIYKLQLATPIIEIIVTLMHLMYLFVSMNGIK